MKLSPLLVVALLAAACDKPETKSEGASAAPPKGSKAEAPASSSAAPTKPATGEPPAAEGPFAAFAKFINEASDALESAARGGKVDPKWGLESKADPQAAKLEGAKRLFASLEVEAISKTNGYLRTNVIVFPDGRVRWVEIAHRPEGMVGTTEGLDKAQPVLAAANKQMVDTLAGDCQLPILAPAEGEKLPDLVKKELKDVKPMLDQTCGAVKGKADGWVPRYDDFGVVFEASGATVLMRSSIRVKDGKLILEAPRVR